MTQYEDVVEVVRGEDNLQGSQWAKISLKSWEWLTKAKDALMALPE